MVSSEDSYIVKCRAISDDGNEIVDRFNKKEVMTDTKGKGRNVSKVEFLLCLLLHD